MYCAKGSVAKENLTHSTYYPPNARQTNSSNKDLIQGLIIENDPSKRDCREVESIGIRAYRIL